MSIALERGGGEGFEGGYGVSYMRLRGGMAPCIAAFESPDTVAGDRTAEESDLGTCSSSSSSIGKDSDLSGQCSGGDSPDSEVQSEFKGPLDALDALEEVLPMRRGISRFYNGKSKSFASLADASSSSIKDIAKPANAYTRKRRNLLAYTQGLDKNRKISKRPLQSSHSTLALAVAMSSSSSESSNGSSSNLNSPQLSPPPLPPLHPHKRPTYSNGSVLSPSSSPSRRNTLPWRSFSLADLQQCTTTTVNPFRCLSPVSDNADSPRD